MIDATQIEVMFKTYGAPPAVKALLAKFKAEGIEFNSIPDQGINAVKELQAYTTGQQVIEAIAAMALGIIEIPMAEPVVDAPTDATVDDTPIDTDEQPTAWTSPDGDTTFNEGDVVVVTEGDAMDRVGEIDSFELRGADTYALVTFEPEQGHTTRDSFAVRCEYLTTAKAQAEA